VGRELKTAMLFLNLPKKYLADDTIPKFRPLFEKLFAQLEQAGMQMMEALSYPLQVEKIFLENGC